jgi:hypothetical protein
MLVLIVAILCVSSLALNERPVIGIFTVPSEVGKYDPLEYSIFYATYVKFVEGAGGLVIM